MLAQPYHEHPHKLDLPCYIQKKYDGVCCLAHINEKGEVRFFSRQSTEWTHLNHLADEIKSIGLRNIVLHGELYAHDVDFQKILSGVKRDAANDITALIQYVVYDTALTNTPYEKRLSVISSLLKPEWHSAAKIKVATTQVVRTVDEIDTLHDKFVSEGFEGAILRNTQGLYEFDKRSYDLLKYKKFQDAEFEIVGAEEAKGKYANTCRFILKTKEGAEFKAYPEGDKYHREGLWSDWNSGKIVKGDIATIKFFEYTTGTNPVPRHPIFKSLRNYD
jgi:ATP-dependent DNA ligase